MQNMNVKFASDGKFRRDKFFRQQFAHFAKFLNLNWVNLKNLS